MKNWLGIEGEPFIAFQTSHLIMLAIYILGLVIFFLSSKKILANTNIYNTIRWILLCLLVLSELSYQAWTVSVGIWSLREHIPLHLCGIASITGAIALITHHKKLIQITFFIGLIPAFLALVTPELPYDIPHFRFWKFFVHHIVISWVSIFLVVNRPVRITFKSMFKTYGYLLIYATIIGFIVNPSLDSNYLYLSNTPTASTPLDLLGNGIWYIINLCLLGLAVFTIQFGVYKLFKRT